MNTIIEYLQYVLLGTILISSVAIMYWYSIYFWYLSYFKKLPIYGTMMPVLGAALAASSKGLHHELLQGFNNKGQTLFSMVGTKPVILTIESKFIEMLCTSKRVRKAEIMYKLCTNFLGGGLLLADGESWKKQRKLVTPAFHSNILEKNVSIFNNHSDRLIELLGEQLNGPSIEISKYAFEYALGVVYESATGISCDHIKNQMTSYIDSLQEISPIVFERFANPLHYFDFTYQFCKDYHRERMLISKLHGLINTTIDLRKQTNGANKDGDNNEKPLFLDILLQNNEVYNQQLIREEIINMFAAGTDTNAATLSFAIYMFSRHPEIQEKLYQEIIAVHKNVSDRNINLDAVSKMNYLHMVVLESLRLFGSVPFIVREFSETTVYNGVTYPKGVSIIIVLYARHRDPKHFKEPNKFIPERHLPENTKNMEPYSFIPFSGGPRNCIGQKYALLAIKIFIYKLLLKFEVLPVKDHQLELAPELVMSAKSGFKIHLKRRECQTL